LAGETQGAADSRKKRRPVKWADKKSADKYYASGDISTVSGGGSDVKGRPGKPPVAIPTPVMKPDDKSADKYYASGGSQRPRAGARLGAKTRTSEATKAITPRTKKPTLLITTKDEVLDTVALAVERVNAGIPNVVVTIKAGAFDLLKRARAALDLAVTQQRLTEDQYYLIRFSYGEEASSPPIIVKPVAPVSLLDIKGLDGAVNHAGAVDIAGSVGVLGLSDPGAVGIRGEEPIIDSSGPEGATGEVGMSDWLGQVNPADDDDDGDFLKPPTESTFVTPTEPTLASSEIVPDEQETVKRPSRKTGRGSK